MVERAVARSSMKGVVLHRDVPAGRHPMRKIVTGLDASPPLQRLFGGEGACRKAIDAAQVELFDDHGYMWVSDVDGCMGISLPYWKKGDELGLYLDLVHELVHVKQFADGRELFDMSYRYVERPTEVEAYHVVVEEARRLGMDDATLFDFLYVEWISHEEHEELCRTLGVPIPAGRKAPVDEAVMSGRKKPPKKSDAQ